MKNNLILYTYKYIICVFVWGVSFPVCIVSFLCSFSWTSFHLLDSSMRLAHSHSHSLTLCNSLSLSLNLCVVCHLSVPMFNSFHSPPFLTPCLFFPFCFVPCSRSGPTIVIYNRPLLSVCCFCVSACHFLIPFLLLPPSLPACLPPSLLLFFCECNPSTLKEPRSHSGPAIASVYWYVI